jgi:hypothetical protein
MMTFDDWNHHNHRTSSTRSDPVTAWFDSRYHRALNLKLVTDKSRRAKPTTKQAREKSNGVVTRSWKEIPIMMSN